MTYMAAQKAGSVVLIILGRAFAGFGAGEIIELFVMGGQPSVTAKRSRFFISPDSLERTRRDDSLGCFSLLR